jgi:hypothetical protein
MQQKVLSDTVAEKMGLPVSGVDWHTQIHVSNTFS